MRSQVLHTEMFFDPQVHTLRGVEFTTFMPGFVKAIKASLPPSCALQPSSAAADGVGIKNRGRWHGMAPLTPAVSHTEFKHL